MSKLLYIEASPRKDRSASIEVAQSFTAAFQDAGSDNEIEILDLWGTQLPEFDGNHINAKYRVFHDETPTDEETRAWDEVTKVVDRFKDADCYLFSLPMWNFSIPYKLKHYIDIISQPGLTWSHSSETGYQGLVTGKPVTVIYARGSEYNEPETSAMDFQKTYMEMFLAFIGFENIHAVLVDPTLTDPGSKQKIIAAAKERANILARQL